MVDWNKLDKDQKIDTGKGRGTYRLTDEDKKLLDERLASSGGKITYSIDSIKELFYHGSGDPKASAIVATLKKRFGEEYDFGTRENGTRIAIHSRT